MKILYSITYKSKELASSDLEGLQFVEIVENLRLTATNGLISVHVNERNILQFANKNDDDIKIQNIDKARVFALRETPVGEKF